MQYIYIHVKLNSDFPCKSSIQQEEESFHQQIGVTLREESSEMLHLEFSFLWR
jgi:hypothetical protein